MSQKANKTTPVIIASTLYSDDAATGTRVDSPEWFAWLQAGKTFSFDSVTFRLEKRPEGLLWYAAKKINGKVRKAHVGRSPSVTFQRLKEVCAKIQI